MLGPVRSALISCVSSGVTAGRVGGRPYSDGPPVNTFSMPSADPSQYLLNAFSWFPIHYLLNALSWPPVITFSLPSAAYPKSVPSQCPQLTPASIFTMPSASENSQYHLLNALRWPPVSTFSMPPAGSQVSTFSMPSADPQSVPSQCSQLVPKSEHSKCPRHTPVSIFSIPSAACPESVPFNSLC